MNGGRPGLSNFANFQNPSVLNYDIEQRAARSQKKYRLIIVQFELYIVLYIYFLKRCSQANNRPCPFLSYGLKRFLKNLNR